MHCTEKTKKLQVFSCKKEILCYYFIRKTDIIYVLENLISVKFCLTEGEIMSIKKYNAFLHIVECGSITTAAKKLGQTQSGVTQLLHALEKDFNTVLLKRSKGGIRLTAEGQKLLPYIKEVVDADTRLRSEVLKLSPSPGKVIKIGTFTSVAVNWLPEILKEYRNMEPDIRFELVDFGYNKIEEAMKDEQMDFCFVPLPISKKYKSFPLYKDRLLAALPKDHPLASLKSCPVSLFEKESVISLIDTIDRDARTVLQDCGIKPNIQYTVEDDYAMLAMVAKNLGICIVPELMLNGFEKDIVFLELDPPSYRTIGIAFPSYEKISPQALRFSEFAIKWIQRQFRMDPNAV